jgi:hypothetical protein
VWLSVLLHACAAAALSAASAVAFRFLTLSPWAGALAGLCLYAAAYALTLVGERPEDE